MSTNCKLELDPLKRREDTSGQLYIKYKCTYISIYGITVVLKDEKNIITRLAVSPVGRVGILVTIYVETFNSDNIVLMCLTLHWPIIIVSESVSWYSWLLKISLKIKWKMAKLQINVYYFNFQVKEFIGAELLAYLYSTLDQVCYSILQFYYFSCTKNIYRRERFWKIYFPVYVMEKKWL